jgi:hypothetical protein
MHVFCAQILVPRCGVRRKTSKGRTRALHSAEMLETNKLFAINSRGISGSTPGCGVDFVQGTDSFRFGVWLHKLWANCSYAHVEVGEDTLSRFEDSSWIDAVHSCSDARGYW